MITDPKVLAEWEAGDFNIGSVAFHTPSAQNNGAFAVDPGYQDVVSTLKRDLAGLYKNDKAWGVGMRYTHRGFDLGWFTSKSARWELAAIVNRVDRKIFSPGTCGEIRFVYRLAYTVPTRHGPFSSRLPATINTVFLLPHDGADCSEMAAVLRKGKPDSVPGTLKSVEVNIQTARWPSTIRPDLGGHADYVLRVFHREGKRLTPAALENTPDVDRIQSSPALKKELLQWIRGHAKAIDEGTAIAPAKFLAMRAVSVTPRGLSRPANRPWTRLFSEQEVSGLSMPPTALLRRLDGLSCMGCHQSRSLAGFHVVGEERDPGRRVDALGVGVSPHVEEDLPRRKAYIEGLIARKPVDDRRRPPERETDQGWFGHACGLDTAFKEWTCAKGLECRSVDGGPVGECALPSMPEGSACRPGDIDFKKDRISKEEYIPCGGEAVCEGVGVGFPGGMCATTCEDMVDHAACGGIALLTPFNECLARGELFSKCAEHQRPAGLRRCGSGDPCRPDYLCSKNTEGQGVCLPPYFVLQMRVDGHPKRPR